MTRQEELEKALEDVVAAWESLEIGLHTPARVEKWLVDDMKPIIDKAREVLKT